MSGYFEKKLLELLPDIYRLEDINGDLQAFLKIPALTLDEIKSLIDSFPDLFDVNACEEKFLPLLGELVGYRYDQTKGTELQRKLIEMSIETYRRKGSIPSANFDMRIAGINAEIEQTYKETARLNKRSRLNWSNLAGRVYSLGAYRVSSAYIISELRKLLENTRPAGTRIFFTQQFKDSYQVLENTLPYMQPTIRKGAIAYFQQTFRLNRHWLNESKNMVNERNTWNQQTVRFTNLESINIENSNAIICSLSSVANFEVAWAANQMSVIEFP